ncbi:hypothetical protein OLN12_17455, partial [Pseudomonas aeruginosa]|nr:hypothetical protein [Pseudomonas aeruginosa]
SINHLIMVSGWWGKGAPSTIKSVYPEKALYQLGLMYLAPDNPHPNRDKAIEYLRRQLLDYPEGELSNKAGRHLDQALNVQPR